MALAVVATLAVAVATTAAMEAIARGSLMEGLRFVTDPARPGWATVGVLTLVLLALEALLPRRRHAALIVVPVALALCFVGAQKRFYLGDPLYPTDFLYWRQIVELMPLMLVERPLMGAALFAGIAATVAALVFSWRHAHRRPPTRLAGRAARLAVAIPALGLFALGMDYASHSSLRSRMNIEPMMWDQKANYAHNGFLMAFALNLPMANVAAPAGYSRAAMDGIAVPPTGVGDGRSPDIVMVMSESFWDPLRLPGTTITPDPLAFTRSVQSGHVFSPEFGGMTSNVEFEALTGFSNAVLPYGSIPYQQYVRGELPSLASYFSEQGYDTLAIHPFQSWFWNRGPVYEAFGFETFLAEEQLGKLPKRGRLASDAALTDLIVDKVDAATRPMFLFAVTLQNHGPYEKDRYPEARLDTEVEAGEPSRSAINSFAEGMKDSDLSLERLVSWAENRERETIIVYFGDHLPPLGPHYVATGFMSRNVGDRLAPAETLLSQRETPLVIWSNRTGVQADIGTISPSLLPYHVLTLAGMEHPFYTGLLGELQERYRVIDRHLTIAADGSARERWQQARPRDPLLRDYGLIQYDAMFGEGYARRSLFAPAGPLIAVPSPRAGLTAPL